MFAIKGLGRVLIQGILNRDCPVVQGAVLVVSAIFVFTNKTSCFAIAVSSSP